MHQYGTSFMKPFAFMPTGVSFLTASLNISPGNKRNGTGTWQQHLGSRVIKLLDAVLHDGLAIIETPVSNAMSFAKALGITTFMRCCTDDFKI